MSTYSINNCPFCGSSPTVEVHVKKEFYNTKSTGYKFQDKIRCSHCGLTAPSIEAWNNLSCNIEAFQTSDTVESDLDDIEYLGKRGDIITEYLCDRSHVCGEPITKVYQDYYNWSKSTRQPCTLTRKQFTREICKRTTLTSRSARHEYFRGETGRIFARR